MKLATILWINFLLILFIKPAPAQDLTVQTSFYITSRIESIAASRVKCSNELRCSSSYTKQFYIQNGYNLVWSDNQQADTIVEKFITILDNSYQDGLNPDDYHLKQINILLNTLKSQPDSDKTALNLANLDMLLTDAFFLYSSDLAFGKVNNREIYPNWIISKRSVNLINILNQVLQTNDINTALDNLAPHYHEYTELKQQLAYYQNLALKQESWPLIPPGPKLKIGMQNNRILRLQKRLIITGELNHINKKGIFDHSLEQALIKFQKSHGLTADGVAGKTTIVTLNIPLLTRIKQIELNMDRLRWLPSDLGERYIIVNIPDFSLKVVDNGQTILTMPVIVGKDEGLQSCVLSSQITYLDINPYWYIPNSIAKNDVLPKLKHDPNYLSKSDIKIFTQYGNNETEIAPSSIKWSKIESGTFPYKLRQDPGPENPLGRIKFIFQNKCGIYLHDTSTPQLFKNSRRDLSHGCIRIGKPIELATYLLSDKPEWTKDKLLTAINDEDNKAITLTKPMNIHIIYATVWVDESSVLQFRNDIYSVDDIPYPVYLPKVEIKQNN